LTTVVVSNAGKVAVGRRRLGGLALGLLLSHVVRAQPVARMRRIGVLTAGGPDSIPPSLFPALRELGWIEGRNIVIDRRTADGQSERAATLATDLVRSGVEVIVTFGAVAGHAAKNATTTIPIVATTGDPVAFGLVSNMSHPGGNITGIALLSPQLASKRLELLRELVPGIVKVGELVDPHNRYWHAVRNDYERAFHALGMDPIFVFVSGAEDLERAIGEIGVRKANALIIRGDPLFQTYQTEIARLAVQHGLPTIAEERRFAAAGALVSYGVVAAPLARRHAVLIDRILNGANPGDLPIEQPSTFELVVNARTASALHLAVPPSVLLRADEVIR